MVLIALPAQLQCLEHLVNDGRHRQRDAVLAACCERNPQIFMMQRDFESRSEIVLQEIGATSWVTTGEMVLISITSVPALAPANTPFSPVTTARTWGESGNMVMTTSLSSATACGLPTVVAPSAASSFAGTGLRLEITNS